MSSIRFKRIRLVFIGSTLLLLLLYSVYPEQSIWQALALVTVATWGLAHGSLDWRLAQYWGLTSTASNTAYFLIRYLMAILFTFCLWYTAPQWALLIFLVMSVVHFGGDWRQEMSRVMSYAMGSLVVTLPALCFAPEVSQLFALLVGEPYAVCYVQGLHYLSQCTLVFLLIQAIRQPRNKHTPGWIIEGLALIGSGVLLPPLLYFSNYFCLLHVTKHWVNMRRLGLYKTGAEVWLSALWPTLVCIAGGILMRYSAFHSVQPDQAWCRTILIGLAALTVPHWFLIERLTRNSAVAGELSTDL